MDNIIKSKSQLAIILSKLKVFENPNNQLEQYPTDSEIAADILWKAYMNKDIEKKIIIDGGCGTGILGIGCLLLGAKKVFFVDIDSNALNICKKNLEIIKKKNFEIIKKNILSINIDADLIIMNPPFGSKKKNADLKFLQIAKTFQIIYSFHIAETKNFINNFAKKNNLLKTHYWEFKFPLKHSMKFHTKKIIRINVGVWRFEQKHI